MANPTSFLSTRRKNETNQTEIREIRRVISESEVIFPEGDADDGARIECVNKV